MRRPHRVVDLSVDPQAEDVRLWIAVHAIRTLNVAGPRESDSPGIQAEAAAFLRQLLSDGR
jgi:hypothetical protein